MAYNAGSKNETVETYLSLPQLCATVKSLHGGTKAKQTDVQTLSHTRKFMATTKLVIDCATFIAADMFAWCRLG